MLTQFAVDLANVGKYQLEWLFAEFMYLQSSIVQTWYLGYWASQYESHDASEVPVG